MKAGLNKKIIIDVAMSLADKQGLSEVTIKALAMELGVKPPALYKHLRGGIDELYQEMTLCGWQSLDNDIARSAVGKSKDEAIIAICYAFRNYSLAHPGVFEVMQWHNSYTTALNKESTQGIIASLYQVLDAYHMNPDEKLHILRLLRGFVQGYAAIEMHGGFGDPISTSDSFDYALRVLIDGIKNVQDNK